MLVFRKAKNYRDKVTITIDTNKATADECLLPLLNELKKMGDWGSSRSIKIEDWDGKNSFSMDGDGPHMIKKITVD